MRRILTTLAVWLALAVPAWATDYPVTCSGTITTALSDAITAATTGDTVTISAGSCVSGNLGQIINKSITLRGSGMAATTLTMDAAFGQWNYTGSNVPNFVMRDMKVTSSSLTGQIMQVVANGDASWRGGFLIKNVDFDFPAVTIGGSIAFYGPIWGVISSCRFNQQGIVIFTSPQLASETGTLDDLGGAYTASLVYRPGASDYLYVEDCTFIGLGATGGAAFDTGYTGGRVVFRHNTFTNLYLYAHWTSHDVVNSLWWEIYNNTFTWNLAAEAMPIRFHGGGTGLVYNNTVTGFAYNVVIIGEGRLAGQSQSPLLFCDGTHDWDNNAGDASAPGWPCLLQVGRNAGKTIAQIRAGDKQASFPLYLWNNGPQAKCANTSVAGDACDNSVSVSINGGTSAYFKATPHTTGGYGNGDVDYSVTASQPSGAGTHTLTYTPYTYPHPLAGGAAAPNAPTNVRIR